MLGGLGEARLQVRGEGPGCREAWQGERSAQVEKTRVSEAGQGERALVGRMNEWMDG